MPNTAKKILIAAGGTGGHIIPAQALAQDLKGKGEILFAADGLKTNPYFDRENFAYQEIKSASPFVGGAVRAAFPIGKGLLQAMRLLGKFRPDLVIGFGSFHSFPMLFAARLKQIPYLLIDANAMPGKVNRIMAKGALATLVQFEETKWRISGESILAQMPLRKIETPLSKEEARSFYGLDPKRTTLLALGGSQGARPINEAVSKLTLDVQVLHLCGKGEEKAVKKGYVAVPFEEKMERAYAAADFALCRGGGSTIAELTEYGLPAVIVPWPRAADRHQEINGRAVEAWGGAKIVDEEKIDKLPLALEQVLANLDLMRKCQKERRDALAKRSTLQVVLDHLQTDKEYARL